MEVPMTGPLLKIADTPPTSVPSDATVQAAVAVMLEARVGAVCVIDDGALTGIFTERDLMRSVVGAGLDPAATAIGDVMVGEPRSIVVGSSRAQALELMLKKHIRHLPVLDVDGRPLGMLSIRNLLRNQVERLRDGMDSLEQYLLADGPGG
jgi:CBS domain-containing protein